MTETTGPTPPPDEATPARPERRWMFIAGAVAGVTALAIGIAVLAATGDDDSPATATDQITAVNQACRQWLDSDASTQGRGPDAGWCDDMAGWMSDHLGSDRMMMGPGGMWASPDAMRDVCLRAMGTSETAARDPAQWCDQMVGWMADHLDDWDDWHNSWGN